MEEMLIQNEKMLSVGGLAAGMAHEINNPLAGIMQTAEVMANRLKDNPKINANIKAAKKVGTTMEVIEGFMNSRGIPRMINAINDSGKRVAKIVDNMLSFSRKSEESISLNDIEEILDKTLELAETDYDLKKQYDFKNIKIIKKYTKDLPKVPCESTKIQQVFLNIFRNGAQAMQTAKIEKPKFSIYTYYDKKRKKIGIEIGDNGPGIDEKTKKRIFEPFFTSKTVGKGTGLGLSVSYFIIVENHGGELLIESNLGFGSKFIIYLPVKGNYSG